MLLTNATLATMDAGYGLVQDGAIAIEGERIAWAGRVGDLPDGLRGQPETDLEGRLVTPGLVDCHTHIVHGGNRAREFEMRLEGATYEEIARAGGGIVSTVAATRAAGEAELLADALPRVDALLAEGVCAIEGKSGYGLDIDTELKMLRAARAIEKARPVRVRTSFLGAHAVPPEYKGRPDAYLDEVCLPALDTAADAGLADAVDGFCEGIAFTPDQIARVFGKARERGLPVKLHAEQLSNLGGARLAAQHGALSADHLEYADDGDAAAMAALEKVASDHSGSKVALLATLRAGQLAASTGQKDKALALYQTLESKTNDKDALRPVVLSGLAFALEASGDNQKAASTFERLVSLPGDVQKDLGLWQAARLFHGLGKTDVARQNAEKLINQYPTSALKKDAEGLLAQLPKAAEAKK